MSIDADVGLGHMMELSLFSHTQANLFLSKYPSTPSLQQCTPRDANTSPMSINILGTTNHHWKKLKSAQVQEQEILRWLLPSSKSQRIFPSRTQHDHQQCPCNSPSWCPIWQLETAHWPRWWWRLHSPFAPRLPSHRLPSDPTLLPSSPSTKLPTSHPATISISSPTPTIVTTYHSCAIHSTISCSIPHCIITCFPCVTYFSHSLGIPFYPILGILFYRLWIRR